MPQQQVKQPTTKHVDTANLKPNPAVKHTAEKPVMEDDITYKRIVEEKPSKADVVAYFRERIEQLKEEYDM